MIELESAADNGMSEQEKEAMIRSAFDNARKDIAIVRAKMECKREEIAVLDATSSSASASTTYDIPPSSGTVLTNSHPQSSEQMQNK